MGRFVYYTCMNGSFLWYINVGKFTSPMNVYGLYILYQRNSDHLVMISQVTFFHMKMVPSPEKWRRLVTTTVGSKGNLNENGFGHLANISRFHPFVFKSFFMEAAFTGFHRVSPDKWANFLPKIPFT